MEVSEAKAVVNDNIRRYIDYLGLNQWTIDIYYKHLDGDRGQAHIRADYMRTSIYLNNDEFENAQDLLSTLRHELIHTFLWPMVKLQTAFEATLQGNEMVDELRDSLYRFMTERMTKEMEMMLDRNGQCSTKPVKRPKPGVK